MYVRAIRTAAAIASAPVFEKLGFVRAWNDAAQPLGDVHLVHAGQRAHVAARDRIDDRARDVRLRVAERDGAERHRAVEVLVPVGVGDATPDGADVVRRAHCVVGTVQRRDALAAGRGARRQNGRRAISEIRFVVFGGDLRFAGLLRLLLRDGRRLVRMFVGGRGWRGRGGASFAPRSKKRRNGMVENEVRRFADVNPAAVSAR